MSKAASSIAKAARMRIIALPLTSEASTSGLHTYYHFQTPPLVRPKSDKSILKKAAEKAGELWAGFGKAPEGSWQVCWQQYTLRYSPERWFLFFFFFLKKT